MSDLSLRELGATAAAYEERLVPALFAPWAEAVTSAAQVFEGQRVLDVACGSGVLTRRIADAVGPGGSVVGLDRNPGMLAVAARLAPAITWQQGEAEALPFEDGAFDRVVSQFGLMLFSDRAAALREMRRVLRPDGRLALAVFDGLEKNAAYAALVSAYERQVGQDIADVLSFPFSLGDRETLLSLFSAAGMASAQATREAKSARFDSVEDMVLADVEGWFPLAGLKLDDGTIEAVVGDASDALAEFVTPAGAVDFPVHVHIVTATAT